MILHKFQVLFDHINTLNWRLTTASTPPDPSSCHMQWPLAPPTHLASLYAPYFFVASYPTVNLLSNLIY